ncbi:MAG: cyclopropane-fatty-acyl-phospholipid synthase family protein [Hyphomicrobiales bacterium]|nr:cyclopropane-fatty-acyl-phospholipid synthase family protein [Hyphomicrobiales bacterium]
MFPLGVVMNRLVKQGRLKITNYDGETRFFGDPNALLDAAIVLNDPDTALKIALYPALKIGEAYTDGTLTIEKGTLLSFLRLLLINNRRWNKSPAGRVFNRGEDYFRLPSVFNPVSRSRRNVKHHYDLSEELFNLFLDSDRQYSCAYFHTEDDDIERAQLNKRQHIAAKLIIEPGQHILDIGSGWGGLGLYLAQTYPVRVTGLTLSEEQHRVSNARARQLGVADRVEFKLMDYRQEKGVYDRIVSVGMFEHVGKPHFSAFFEKVHSLLKEDGVALIHTIGQVTPPGPINPWIRRYIFPGAYLPTLSQVSPILERQGYWLTDMENLRLHYAMTLSAWHDRFQSHRDHVVKLYDERFCRMWEFYLKSCEAGFRWGGLTVFQFQLARDIGVVPITRDYMVHEEGWLRSQTAAPMQAHDETLWARPAKANENSKPASRSQHH